MTTDMPRLNCKYFAVQVDCDIDFDKLKKYVVEKHMNGVSIENKKIFVFGKQNGSMLRYKNGLVTLTKKLGLSKLPLRITGPSKRADVLSHIVKSNAELFKTNNGIQTYGAWTIQFCNSKYLKHCSKGLTNSIKLHNDIIAKEGAIGAVKRNTMDYCTALRQEQAFQQIRDSVTSNDYCNKDVPNGHYIFAKFAPYGKYKNHAHEAEKYARFIKIKSHLGEGVNDKCTIHRKKHYVIYSKESAWGKSTFANMLVKNYNAQRITHVNNFCGIRENIQFLILDEYSGGFSDENLKLITSGDASSFTGNRKSHGKGWIPRPDLQLIFLMNESLFAYHGKYDSKYQCRVINQSLRDTFGQRFIYIKLDSTPYHDEAVDILRFCMPSILTINERMRYLAYLYNKWYILQRQQRLDNIDFCCGKNYNLLNQVQYDEVKEDRLDKHKFITEIQKKFNYKSKTMLKIIVIGLKNYINDSLHLRISMSVSDLDDLHNIIDQIFDE